MPPYPYIWRYIMSTKKQRERWLEPHEVIREEEPKQETKKEPVKSQNRKKSTRKK